eukprot:364063-Chlamydomonas_euryale.AAC.1
MSSCGLEGYRRPGGKIALADCAPRHRSHVVPPELCPGTHGRQLCTLSFAPRGACTTCGAGVNATRRGCGRSPRVHTTSRPHASRLVTRSALCGCCRPASTLPHHNVQHPSTATPPAPRHTLPLLLPHTHTKCASQLCQLDGSVDNDREPGMHVWRSAYVCATLTAAFSTKLNLVARVAERMAGEGVRGNEGGGKVCVWGEGVLTEEGERKGGERGCGRGGGSSAGPPTPSKHASHRPTPVTPSGNNDPIK